MSSATIASNFPVDRPSSPNSIRISGFEHESESEFLIRHELIQRRVRRVRQMAEIYRDHNWALMEELRWKYMEYCWEYRKNPFVEDDEEDGIVNSMTGENGSGNSAIRCCVNGCKAKNMALTRFCHMHILSDAKQKLYKPCNFSIKSSTTGPILCEKPILRSIVPSYCPLHFQKAENHMARALKKAGLNVSLTNKVSPKFHVIVAEYVHQIKNKRRAAQVNLENAGVMDENEC